MDGNFLLLGGAALAALTAGWNYIKSFIWNIFNLFFQYVNFEPTNLYFHTNNSITTMLLSYLISKYKMSSFREMQISTKYDYLKSKRKYDFMPIELIGATSLVFWNGWFPLFCFVEKNKENTSNSFPHKITFIYLRGTFNIDNLVKEAYQECNEKIATYEKSKKETANKRFTVNYVPEVTENSKNTSSDNGNWHVFNTFRLIANERQDIGYGRSDKKKCLDFLFFPEKVTSLIEEVKVWAENEEWFRNRGIPWKKGWLLYGPPGTGKSSLARAFAEDLDMPIFIFNLAELSNYTFVKAWLNMLKYTPCIALIEDIDNVFHGRENITMGRNRFFSLISDIKENKKETENLNNKTEEKEGESSRIGHGWGLSFDILINCIDGAIKSEGVFTIITTNNIDKIDSALGKPVLSKEGKLTFASTRPGRIDKAIKLTYMEKKDKVKMAKHILDEFPDILNIVLNEIEESNLQETPAQFAEKCSSLALEKFWKEKNK